MPDETVDSTADEMPPEVREQVADYVNEAALVLHDPTDQHEVSLVLDEHDIRMLLTRVQSNTMKKWVYAFDGHDGLSVDGVGDLISLLNYTGRVRIGLLPETLKVDRVELDIGNGPEPMYEATIFARDEVTGETWSGTSLEPLMMRLSEGKAAKWRRSGKTVPDDRRVFDKFAKTKAVNKAERNALDKFIPLELKEVVIAAVSKDPSRVERIQTKAQQQAEAAEPMLTDDRARVLLAEADGIYAEIKELGGGQGKMFLVPGTFNAWKMRSWHDHAALETFLEYLRAQREEIAARFSGEGS